MLKQSKTKFWFLLMLTSTSSLTSCAATDYNFCPSYPIAGIEVSKEIENINAPHFWEWLGRINKLRKQLELCKQH